MSNSHKSTSDCRHQWYRGACLNCDMPVPAKHTRTPAPFGAPQGTKRGEQMTNETGFTPGPWHHENRTVYAPNSEGTNRFSLFVSAAGSGAAGYDELRANASLIAAAPDLFAALTAVLALETRDPPDRTIWAAVHAALAKAGGK